MFTRSHVHRLSHQFSQHRPQDCVLDEPTTTESRCAYRALRARQVDDMVRQWYKYTGNYLFLPVFMNKPMNEAGITISSTVDRAKVILRQHQGLLHTSQASALGITTRTLYALRNSGELIQLSRGVYRLHDLPPLENADLTQVASRVSKGVICLVSALAFHGLTTHIPHQVYVALPNHAETPRLSYPPLRLVWLSGLVCTSGIEAHVVDGIPVQVYCIAKTVADCFKFRNKIGIDVAVEALKDCLSHKRCSINDLLKYAQIDRVERVMRPYLEALV